MPQTLKDLPITREIQVQTPGQEDPLEKEMENHFSILAWRISWAEEPGGLQSTGSHRVGQPSDYHAICMGSQRVGHG